MPQPHRAPYLFTPSYRLPRQSGVVLIVVLIMLVVIGLVSASAMRNAITADQITNNSRLENLAKQAAQIALRYCEAEANKPAPAISIISAPTTAAPAYSWETYTNWTSTPPVATTLTADYMKSSDSAFTPSKLPQCMAQYSSDGPNLIVITARGFGPDYVASTNSGAVVWLQSTIAVEPAAPATPTP